MDERGNVDLPERGRATSSSTDVPTTVASHGGAEDGESAFLSFGNDSNLPERVRKVSGLRDTHTRVISWVKDDPGYCEWICCEEWTTALGQSWSMFLRYWPTVHLLALALVVLLLVILCLPVVLLCLPLAPIVVLFYFVHYLNRLDQHTVWVWCEMDLKIVSGGIESNAFQY
jgi:hypothetical protein